MFLIALKSELGVVHTVETNRLALNSQQNCRFAQGVSL